MLCFQCFQGVGEERPQLPSDGGDGHTAEAGGNGGVAQSLPSSASQAPLVSCILRRLLLLLLYQCMVIHGEQTK